MTVQHLKQLAWFVAYWLMGVAVVFLVALIIRSALI
jgi:hypothetical protein